MYLRNNKDPQFKTGVFSSQWFLKHSVCSSRQEWTLNSFITASMGFGVSFK